MFNPTHQQESLSVLQTEKVHRSWDEPGWWVKLFFISTKHTLFSLHKYKNLLFYPIFEVSEKSLSCAIEIPLFCVNGPNLAGERPANRNGSRCESSVRWTTCRQYWVNLSLARDIFESCSPLPISQYLHNPTSAALIIVLRSATVEPQNIVPHPRLLLHPTLRNFIRWNCEILRLFSPQMNNFYLLSL